MTTTNSEEQATKAAGTAQLREPEPPKKANVAPRKPHVRLLKAKAGKMATSAIKGAKAPKKGNKAKAEGAPPGSKTETILALLKRSGGTTLKEIMKATGWQAHSVRGFLSVAVSKKMGLTVTSVKEEDGERTYSIKG
jgi:hypothetical protein